MPNKWTQGHVGKTNKYADRRLQQAMQSKQKRRVLTKGMRGDKR